MTSVSSIRGGKTLFFGFCSFLFEIYSADEILEVILHPQSLSTEERAEAKGLHVEIRIMSFIAVCIAVAQRFDELRKWQSRSLHHNKKPHPNLPLHPISLSTSFIPYFFHTIVIMQNRSQVRVQIFFVIRLFSLCRLCPKGRSFKSVLNLQLFLIIQNAVLEISI